ncbi:MAG TPA: hypothetical protein VFI29_13915 [Hanamia sp.]|nr:hypothetical protein [Hanamia sp.]
MNRLLSIATFLFVASVFFAACNTTTSQQATQEAPSKPVVNETPEYFNLRPALEHEYGYTHAVRIGNDLKISGAVSMDDS